MKVSEKTIQEWVKKKKHIQDRLNRIRKRLKKYNKQEKHFQFRLSIIKKYEESLKKLK